MVLLSLPRIDKTKQRRAKTHFDSRKRSEFNYVLTVDARNYAERDHYQAIMGAIRALDDLRRKRNDVNKMIHIILQGTFIVDRVISLPSNCILDGLHPSKCTLIKKAFSDPNVNTGLVTNDSHGASGYDGDRNIVVQNMTLKDDGALPRGTLCFFAHSKRILVRNCIFQHESTRTQGHAIEFNSTRHACAINNEVTDVFINSNTLEGYQYDVAENGSQIVVEGRTFNADGTRATDVFFSNTKFNRANVAVGAHRNMLGSRVFVHNIKVDACNVYGVRNYHALMNVHSCNVKGATVTVYTGNRYGYVGVNSNSIGGAFAISNSLAKEFITDASASAYGYGIFASNASFLGISTNSIENSHVFFASSAQKYLTCSIISSIFDEPTTTRNNTLIDGSNQLSQHLYINNILAHANANNTSALLLRNSHASSVIMHRNTVFAVPSTFTASSLMNSLTTRRIMHHEYLSRSGMRTFIDFDAMTGNATSQSITTPLAGMYAVVQPYGASNAVTATDKFITSSTTLSNTVNNAVPYKVKLYMRL